MAYYNTCPNCGSNLDPGEKCDCTNESQTNEFLCCMLDLKKNDPAGYVSACALLIAMSESQSNKYSLKYPKQVFLDAIRKLEDHIVNNADDTDLCEKLVQAIAHICDNWLDKATDAA